MARVFLLVLLVVVGAGCALIACLGLSALLAEGTSLTAYGVFLTIVTTLAVPLCGVLSLRQLRAIRRAKTHA